MVLWEKYLNVCAAFKIVPAKPGKIFSDDRIYLPTVFDTI